MSCSGTHSLAVVVRTPNCEPVESEVCEPSKSGKCLSCSGSVTMIQLVAMPDGVAHVLRVATDLNYVHDSRIAAIISGRIPAHADLV